MNIGRISKCARFFPAFFIFAAVTVNAQTWSAKLDDTIRFYQPTDVGAIIVGTKKSVYAIDGTTGDVLWRRKNAALDENEIAPVPGTDLGLLSFESVVNRDYPVVFASIYILALLGLAINLLSDFIYTLVDPRIDFETREV